MTGDVPLMIESTVAPNPTKPLGYGFRGWKYATIRVSWGHSDSDDELDVCLDTGCSVSLIDRAYLKRVLPNAEIRKMSLLMPVRGVGNKVVKTDEYAIVKMYVRGSVAENPATAAITMEVHLVNDLKANLLVGNDNLKPQGMVLDFGEEKVTLGSCQNLTAKINIHSRASPNAKRTIKTKSAFVVPPRTTMRVPVAYNGEVPPDRDYLFEPNCA